MLFLKEFWKGEISPGETRYHTKEQYSKPFRTMERCERVIKVDETHFSVTAKVEISDQFFGWLLGFGRKAKLLYPEDVLEQFRTYMDRIREMY